MSDCVSDLLVIGGGPAGLSAAINGASEGLDVRLIDSGAMLGGQARESSGIENYPGFPDAVTGDELMSRFVQQAYKFNTGMICPVAAASIRKEPDGTIVVVTDDYHEYGARAAILSIGLSYRRLGAKNIGKFMGRGVYYGVPNGKAPRNVIVVGGANSAGQAALGLSKNKKCHVQMVIRKTIDVQMSQYLVDRIRAAENIDVCEHCEVVEVCGDTHMKEAVIQYSDGTCANIKAEGMYVFIGAVPRTLWLQSAIAVDDKKFIKTWAEVGAKLPYETSMEGVFAAGDVRSGSIKRIAAAAGEGGGALQMVHRYLGERNGK